MRRTFVGVLGMAILAAAALGCGSSDDGTATQSPTATTPAAESPAAESPTAESPAAEDGWTTVTTLRSDDPTTDIGFLLSEEFTVSGEVRLVLDVPGGEDTDGLIAAILPAGEEITVELAQESESRPLAVIVPEATVDGLDGSYVVLATPSTDKAWSLQIQTKP